MILGAHKATQSFVEIHGYIPEFDQSYSKETTGSLFSEGPMRFSSGSPGSAFHEPWLAAPFSAKTSSLKRLAFYSLQMTSMLFISPVCLLPQNPPSVLQLKS